LLLRGAVLSVGVTALAAIVGWLVSTLAHRLGAPGVIVEAIGLKVTISLQGLINAARAVGGQLANGDLTSARLLVAHHLVSRPTADLDEAHVASATIESVAENLTDGFVAPVCVYLAFGMAGALAYRAVNTTDAMIGYRIGTLEHFGKFAARLDDLLNLVPARIAGGAIAVAASLTGNDGAGAWSTMRREHGLTASPNAGWMMAAMAGALGVVLEKPGPIAWARGLCRDPPTSTGASASSRYPPLHPSSSSWRSRYSWHGWSRMPPEASSDRPLSRRPTAEQAFFLLRGLAAPVS
jgi:adenosylcobinamide-phosphate synthase